MSEKLEIVITAKDKNATKTVKKLTTEFGKAEKSLDKFGKAGARANRSIKGFGASIGKFSGAMLGVAGAAAGAGFALKQAFELGKQGAAIEQTTESFDDLIERVNIGIDTLEAMRKGTRRTVDDLTLMSSTLTLTAGTTGNYEQALVAIMPRLAEMAKAANKLNPTLGTTKFQLESLATAAKRQSIMIADNAGLTIKMESAVKRVHPQLRILTDEYEDLTQQQKFLNEMLWQGDKLISQVGGSVDSATDSFEQLITAISNVGDGLKQDLGTGMIPVIDHLVTVYNASKMWDKAIGDNIVSAERYSEVLQDVVFRGMTWEDALVEITRRTEEHATMQQMASGYAIQAMDAETRAMHYMSMAALDWTKYLEGGTEANWDFTESTKAIETEFSEAAFAMRDAKSAVVGYNAAIRSASSAGAMIAEANRGISSSISNLRADLEWLMAGGLEIQMQFEQVKQAVLSNAITPEEAHSLLENLYIQAEGLEVELGDISIDEAARNVADELGITFDKARGKLDDLQSGVDTFDIAQPFQDALDPTGELRDLFDQTGDNLQGLIDLEAAAYMEGWGSALDTSLNPSLEDAKGLIDDVGRELTELPDAKDIYVTVHYQTIGDASVTERQHGGPVEAFTPYIVGEAGPELFVPNAAGDIVPNDQIAFGNEVNNYYYMTINDAGSRGDIATDCTIFKALTDT